MKLDSVTSKVLPHMAEPGLTNPALGKLNRTQLRGVYCAEGHSMPGSGAHTGSGGHANWESPLCRFPGLLKQGQGLTGQEPASCKQDRRLWASVQTEPPRGLSTDSVCTLLWLLSQPFLLIPFPL